MTNARWNVGRLLFSLLVLPAALSYASQPPATGAPRMFTISGRVIDSHGKPPTDLDLWIAQGDGEQGMTSSTPLEADGTFTSSALTPGRYVVATGPRAEPGGIPPGFEGGVTGVTLNDRDVAGLVIYTHPSVSVRGHLRYDGEGPDARHPTVHVMTFLVARGAISMSGSSAAQVQPDGTFEMHNVFGPSLIRTGYGFPDRQSPWWPGPVMLDGHDITDVPIEFEQYPNADVEVVFTQHYTGLDGRASDETGLPSGNACVAIFSADRERWQLWASTTKFPRTDADGRFYALLPAGSYMTVALPATACGSRGEAMRDFSALARNATSVTIADGETRHLSLTARSRSSPRDWK
jgi:hypothetical protein